MSTKSLVPVDYSQLPSTQVGDDAVYGELAKSTEFLGRLQLYSKGKAIDKGLISPGHFGIPETGDEITDLGKTVDMLVFARRPKALDMSDTENLIIVYDNNSDEFKRIAAQSSEKESHCMYGPSFLVYDRASGRFLEFFCGSKSLRAEAKHIYAFLPLSEADIKARGLKDAEPHGPLPFTMKSKYVEKGSYSWFVPVVGKCSTPFANAPKIEDVMLQVEKFINPKQETTEVVQEPETGKKKRTR